MSRWHVHLHITLIVKRDISTYSTANILNYCKNKWPKKFFLISGNYNKYSTRFWNYRNLLIDQNKNTL